MATIQVKVGELRNRLSQYLKKVRQGGEILISDRETPIGRIIPFRKGKGEGPIQVMEPAKGYGGLAKIHFPDIECSIDPLGLLMEDRRKR